MSAPIITTPENPITRCQAISDVIESIALEETGLAHIINAEGEKIQAALELATSIDDLVTINESVRKTLVDISKVQMLLQYKLDIAGSLECEETEEEGLTK
ncbi:MAG: hypothetical protein ACK5LY_08130 [Lachnospirales bacterium]